MTAPAWNCYLLVTADAGPLKTYVGITPDLDRRLKQHNGLQSGGAAATRGRTWRRAAYVTGFPDQTAALQFEWAWKNRTKRYRGAALARRFQALQELLADSRPTALAAPYETYPTPLEVVIAPETELPTLA
jgi:predicted GIY-YIG superfamily endonuclease